MEKKKTGHVIYFTHSGFPIYLWRGLKQMVTGVYFALMNRQVLLTVGVIISKPFTKIMKKKDAPVKL